MNPFRILLLSNTRPSRAWKVAARIVKELDNAEICGLVQRPMHTLPQAEQMLASGCLKRQGWMTSALIGLMDGALWLVHGCPRYLKRSRFSVDRLAEQSRSAEMPFRVAEDFSNEGVADFICKQGPDLIIVLGEFHQPHFAELSRSGLISASQRDVKSEGTKGGREISIEHVTHCARYPLAITGIRIPLQPYDIYPEVNLKTDLIADDLLVQTAKQLQLGVSDPAEAVTRWADTMLMPYLRQLETAASATVETTRAPLRFRSIWKLCLDTLLLCSPLIAGRNWYRRLRGRYPVLILAHHLVADRPHPMGISTAHFWQQSRFLQKHYRLVSLSDAIRLLRSGKINVPTLALTFDDGYLDNFLNLRAVAEEEEFPIAQCVVSEPVENHREFQHDSDAGITGALPLTWEHIRYWSALGAEIGSHTRTHFDCGSTHPIRLQEEIAVSKTDLERHLHHPVRFFAFPFGKQENISPQALKLAESTYSHVLSCFGGENAPNSEIHHQHLLRKTHYSSPWELELELQSVFDLVKKMKQMFCAKRAQAANLPEDFCGIAQASSPRMPADLKHFFRDVDPNRSTRLGSTAGR